MGEVDQEKRPVRALVIGTCHEYQRHQDRIEERKKVRADLERLACQLIADRSISLIAEEAGDNTEVWEQLKLDEEATPPELQIFFAGTEAVGGPQDTIAKRIADELSERLRHFDIRPPHAEEITTEQRDEAMARSTMEVLGPANSVLVICGESHRLGVCRHLENYGLRVESFCFP